MAKARQTENAFPLIMEEFLVICIVNTLRLLNVNKTVVDDIVVAFRACPENEKAKAMEIINVYYQAVAYERAMEEIVANKKKQAVESDCINKIKNIVQ